jgi:anhydro-N-acetylmuramic acid kinase
MADASAGERLSAGAMSGTSADGVDVAIVAVGGRGTDMRVRLLCHRHRPYDAELRRAIFAVREGDAAKLSEIAHLSRSISRHYAKTLTFALAEAGLEPAQIAAVAAHGQTVYHAPPDTIQLLDPALLAAEAGCAVVGDFRRADCAAGGQGAPLVPYADFLLFRSTDTDRIVVNIGGIANVTCLFRASPTLDRVIAYDTGPGNCISDHLMRRHDPDGPGYDVGGALALRGRVSRLVLDAFRAHDYFRRRPPKSTDGPEMIRAFERAVREYDPDLSLEDQLATAAAAVAIQVMWAGALFGGHFHGEWIVSGGGVRNRAIMDQLAAWVGAHRVRTTDEFGVPGPAKEAMAFALLGAATLDGLPSSVPSATGASRAVVLGSITPKP